MGPMSPFAWGKSGDLGFWELHMSYSLNSLKGGYIGDYIGFGV